MIRCKRSGSNTVTQTRSKEVLPYKFHYTFPRDTTNPFPSQLNLHDNLTENDCINQRTTPQRIRDVDCKTLSRFLGKWADSSSCLASNPRHGGSSFVAVFPTNGFPSQLKLHDNLTENDCTNQRTTPERIRDVDWKIPSRSSGKWQTYGR